MEVKSWKFKISCLGNDYIIRAEITETRISIQYFGHAVDTTLILSAQNVQVRPSGINPQIIGLLEPGRFLDDNQVLASWSVGINQEKSTARDFLMMFVQEFCCSLFFRRWAGSKDDLV